MLLGAVMIVAGAMHFVSPRPYQRMMPRMLERHAALLVAVSGAGEIACGVGLLAGSRAAAWALVALLVAVFPANVYMALAHDRFAAVAPAWLFYARLPLQALLIGWMWTLRSPRG